MRRSTNASTIAPADTAENGITFPPVVSRENWEAALERLHDEYDGS